MRGDRGWRECERGQGMERERQRQTEGDRKRYTSAIPALSRVGM